MKRKVRRLAWVGVALCVVLLALGVTERLLEPSPGVTDANLRRIRNGMTLNEVEGILGGPAYKWGSWVNLDTGEKYSKREWQGPAGHAIVSFSEDGRVTNVSRAVNGGDWAGIEEARPFDRLLSLFGW
jgi:hypothetical protein